MQPRSQFKIITREMKNAFDLQIALFPGTKGRKAMLAVFFAFVVPDNKFYILIFNFSCSRIATSSYCTSKRFFSFWKVCHTDGAASVLRLME